MSVDEAAPRAAGAAVGRRIGQGVMHGLWRPRVLGSWRVPSAGPVILAGNHAHNIDGPMLLGTAPRPVHFLVKKEAFVGPLAPFLRSIGQLSVDRAAADRAAVTQALAVLRAGGVLGIFPEGSRGSGDFAALRGGLAYFAVRSGAPVVPVAVLGSVRPGQPDRWLPPLRSRIDVVFGEPFGVGDGTGARTRRVMDRAAEQIQARLRGHLDHARRLTSGGAVPRSPAPAPGAGPVGAAPARPTTPIGDHAR